MCAATMRWCGPPPNSSRAYNVGISIGDVMAESSWVDVADFPIAELQIDGEFINGCADDPAKRMACEMAVDIAKKLNAKTLAKNLERTADSRRAGSSRWTWTPARASPSPCP